MKDLDFLSKIKSEEKIELVEQSQRLCDAYMIKSDEYLKMSKLLHENRFYEGSIINSYYAMYYASLALLFKSGIKSENHTATIILLKEFFNVNTKSISMAKKDRIDSQYYLKSSREKVDAKISGQSIKDAEEYSTKIKLLAESLKNTDIDAIRKKFLRL